MALPLGYPLFIVFLYKKFLQVQTVINLNEIVEGMEKKGVCVWNQQN